MDIKYATLIFLPNIGNGTDTDVHIRMKSVLKETHPLRIEETASVDQSQILNAFWDDWSISLHYSEDSYILEESQDIAEKYAQNRGDKEVIRNCRTRIELSSDTDSYGEHFNDYIAILEQIEIEFRGAILFDTQTKQFI